MQRAKTTEAPTIANRWFSTRVTYDGIGRAEFLDPSGFVEGPVSVHFDEFGESSVEMTVERIQTDQPLQLGLMELFSGSKPVRTNDGVSIGIGGLQNPCTKLTVSSRDGTFTATEGLQYGFGIHLEERGANPTTLSFHPLRSQFECLEVSRARYWVLPLSNFISRFPIYHPDIDSHPLRVSYDERQNGSGTRSLNRVITFDFGGNLGYVQPLAHYETRVTDLEQGRERHGVTALMVGEVGANSVDEGEWENWFPFDFFRLMSFATGAPVGAPWIEFRDSTGQLVKRVHRTFELAPFTQGHRAIEEGIHSGLGYLLTQYQSSADRGQPFLNVALKHINQAASYDGSVEDMTVYLCRALEGLCDHYGFKTQYLLQQLDQTRQEQVIDALEAAMRQIRAAARSATSAGLPDQARVMERIADRARSNAANKDVDFGLAVADLLKHFDFPDADIVDDHYQRVPRTDGIPTWNAVLSHYRGTIMHRGHYKFSSGTHDIDDVIRINDHLLDILIRMVFKIVGYDGTYQPPVLKATDVVPVDWVTGDLPANRLGYNRI
jgi:hypothetical protein